MTMNSGRRSARMGNGNKLERESMTEQGTPLQEYLRTIAADFEERGWADRSVHDYVLRRGRAFRSEPLTREEQKYIDLCGWQKHPIKQCYRNAQMAALTMPLQEGMSLLYVEGFVDTGMGIGINHAWLSLNGKLVDTTIRADRKKNGRKKNGRGRAIGLIPEGWEYYGVEMDPQKCLHSLEHDGIGPLIDDWACGWPMLAGEEREKERTAA